MNTVSFLFIGDIIGKPGLDFFQVWIHKIKEKYKPDLMVVNGENISDGKGCTREEGRILFENGVDVITGGNHSFDKQSSQNFLKDEPRCLRPLNYPKGTYGNGYHILEKNGISIAIMSLQGRAFMYDIDCPFRVSEYAIEHQLKECKIKIIDFHAESTAEKYALLNFHSGRVSAIIGTHTHIQTSDEQITAKGTAYITEVGMSGPYDSVIGMKTDAAVNRFLFQTPQRYETAHNDCHICGVSITIDTFTGKALSIERILFPDLVKNYKV